MKKRFKIKTLRFDDADDVKFQIYFSNEICKSTLEFYGHDEFFKKFAQDLIDFPKDITEVVTFQIGEDLPKWAYSLSVKVFCVEPNGKSIFRILMDNHEDIVNGFRSEFTIVFEIAEINKIGEALFNWKPEEDSEFSW